MLRGLWKLTWIETKIFVREPLGLIGSVLVPVVTFVVLGRTLGGGAARSAASASFLASGLPVFASVLVALSAVLSLVTVISIYREGGILKRLRATPLRPQTILAAHVLVKLGLTATTALLLLVAGKRYYPVDVNVHVISYTIALVFSTLSILSIGFVIASLIPTARFAQPAGTFILYPMLALSGLFVPISVLPPTLQAVSRVLPLTYAVSLLSGIWAGDPWSAHMGDVAALVVVMGASSAISARVFRWE